MAVYSTNKSFDSLAFPEFLTMNALADNTFL